MTRDELKLSAENTVKIQNDGYYVVNGKKVSIKEDMDNCIKNTVLYIDDIDISKTIQKEVKLPKYEFTSETTMSAAKRLLDEKGSVCVLNFASAKYPGGGFLGGSMAQEESIAYLSGLYESLKKFGKDFYRYHIENTNAFYSDRIIYSKNVPVFKDEKHNLLEVPYKINIITSPAVNAGVVKNWNNKKEIEKINPTMEGRIRKIIKTAIINGDKHLVLGAFGCGVFKNDLEDIAKIFKKILVKEKYHSYFETITFAIYDRSGMSAVNKFKGKFLY